MLRAPSPRRPLVSCAALAVTVPMLVAGAASPSPAGGPSHDPVLVARAVLPVETYAGPPESGWFVIPGEGIRNGIHFPLAEQPVEGFSGIVDGRDRGEILAMPDNGFGGKANSVDFLIRAYHLRPDFKTADGGSGTVEVGDFISFRDPRHQIGFPIVNEGTEARLLTGGDIDPESLQRGRHGDLWVGDEFGPWILHFDSRGRLLDPPFPLPGNLMSPNNPFLVGPFTHPNSRGLEAMAISPDGKYLYGALEGALLTDAATAPRRRLVYEFSIRDEEFTGRAWQYRTEQPGHFVSDMQALDRHRLVVVERDGGSGINALFRRVYRVDLTQTDASGFLEKTELVDLAAIPDPDLVSLPALHPGDVGLGDPFQVTCESVEAVHVVHGNRILVGCDNNLPNSGRNPGLADDNEFILVDAPRLRGHEGGRD
jgi:glycerophosphoryl diester phosphodiesterase